MSRSRLVLSQLVFIMPINIPSQESDFYGLHMLSDEVGDVAAEWAKNDDLRMLLQRLLILTLTLIPTSSPSSPSPPPSLPPTPTPSP